MSDKFFSSFSFSFNLIQTRFSLVSPNCSLVFPRSVENKRALRSFLRASRYSFHTLRRRNLCCGAFSELCVGFSALLVEKICSAELSPCYPFVSPRSAEAPLYYINHSISISLVKLTIK